MNLKEGVRDGAFLGLGILLFFVVKNFNKLQLFGGEGAEYYPDGTNPSNFDPNKVLSPGDQSIEVLKIQQTLNKYNYNITANGLECVEPISGSGGYFNYKVPENGTFDSDTETILLNRYGVTGSITYKQLIDGIKKNQGLNNYIKC
jgi:hypothetical protein